MVSPVGSDMAGENEFRQPSPPTTQRRTMASRSSRDRSGSLSSEIVSRRSNSDEGPQESEELTIARPMIQITTVPSIPVHTSSSITSMSSTNGASYDGSSGRSFPLVTAKWIREHPDEVQQARDAEEQGSDGHNDDDDEDDNESIVEDYHANRDGLTVLSYKHASENDRASDAQSGGSKIGKLTTKTGEKLGSDRLAEKGRKKRVGHLVA